MPKRIDKTAVPPARIRTVSEIATIETSRRRKNKKGELIKPC
jgi:hypothetical protein